MSKLPPNGPGVNGPSQLDAPDPFKRNQAVSVRGVRPGGRRSRRRIEAVPRWGKVRLSQREQQGGGGLGALSGAGIAGPRLRRARVDALDLLRARSKSAEGIHWLKGFGAAGGRVARKGFGEIGACLPASL